MHFLGNHLEVLSKLHQELHRQPTFKGPRLHMGSHCLYRSSIEKNNNNFSTLSEKFLTPSLSIYITSINKYKYMIII